MPRPPRHPAFWSSAFAVWFAVLWFLSSLSPSSQASPEIPHLDKVAHFGYFFGGAGLLAASLYRLNPATPHWRRIILLTVLILLSYSDIEVIYVACLRVIGWFNAVCFNVFVDYPSDSRNLITIH